MAKSKSKPKADLAVSELTKPQKFYVDHFMNQKTLEELADELVVSPEQISAYLATKATAKRPEDKFERKKGVVCMTGAQSKHGDDIHNKGRPPLRTDCVHKTWVDEPQG